MLQCPRTASAKRRPESRADARPLGNESPLQERGLAVAFELADAEHRLRGGDVVAEWERWNVGQPKGTGDLVGGSLDGVAAAHAPIVASCPRGRIATFSE